MYLKLILKSPGFVLFEAILIYFRAKPDIHSTACRVPSRRGVGWLGQWPRHQCQLSRVTLISCPPLSTPAPPCQWMCALQCMSVLLMMYLALVEQLLMTSKCVAPTLPHPYVSFLCITLHLFIETNKKNLKLETITMLVF